MTTKQITKKLMNAGLNLDNLTIGRDEVEVRVADIDGDCKDAATRTLKNKVARTLGWGGFRCGHGGWVLRNDYKVSSLEGIADPIHY